MKHNYIFTLLMVLIITCLTSAQIYVAPDGSDLNSGTIDNPLKTIPKAVSKMAAGDTIYMRGGVYELSAPISISKKGSDTAGYYLFAYGSERPLLDFSSMEFNSGNRGIKLSGTYWHIKGLDIMGAGDNGMNVTGSYNTIEFCSFYRNKDTGLQLGGGASYNNIINCDSYFNADPSHGNADGFAHKLDVGTGNYFYGCRAWQNSDDGWDGYLRGADDVASVIENSWCFANGYMENGSASSGNGNGYKMGGGDNSNSDNLAHDITLINSIAFDNRVKGFDQNNNRGTMLIYNGSAYRNGTNYSIPSVINGDEKAEIINSVAVGAKGNLASFVVEKTNSWMSSFTVTDGDFLSLDTTGVRGPRNADGSLPVISFLRLAAGSDLINAGTDIGLPYTGSAPDLGAFQYTAVLPVELTAFSAEANGKSVVLRWSTASETNNLGFEVQVSSGTSNTFYTKGFVKGTGTTTESQEYLFEDKTPAKGKLLYRIKQIDYDGTYEYSNTIEVSNFTPADYVLKQNYPNPFNPVTSIEFTIPAGYAELKIYDVLGNEVTSLFSEMKEAGSYIYRYNASQLASGIYYYALTVKGEQVFRATGKMVLMK